MTTKTIDKVRQLVKEVMRIASARPEVKYYGVPDENSYNKVRCSNLDGTCTDGSKGCIVGQGVLAMGIPEAELKKHINSDVDSLSQELLGFEPEEYTANPDMSWLQIVQAAQDAGMTWGDAVRKANTEVNLKKRDVAIHD
jgi:hypothetical protein